MKPLVHQHMLMSVFLTCTEPGSVPGQNYVDLEAAVCWLNWDWEAVPVNWVPAHRGDRGRDGAYLFQLGRILCWQMHTEATEPLILRHETFIEYLFAKNCLKIQMRANDLSSVWHQKRDVRGAQEEITRIFFWQKTINKSNVNPPTPHRHKQDTRQYVGFALCLQCLETTVWKNGILRTRMYLKRDEPGCSLCQ